MGDIKTPSESETIITAIVYPDDTNPMGFLNGGRILQWMDTACAISAQMHAGFICVTAAIDGVKFLAPAKLGDIVQVRAKATRVFSSSMEIYAEARATRTTTGKHFLINTAYFIFVGLDDELSKPARLPELTPVTEEEQEQHRSALRRKEARCGRAPNSA